MPLDETFIKKAVQAAAYELSLHADEERLLMVVEPQHVEAVSGNVVRRAAECHEPAGLQQCPQSP